MRLTIAGSLKPIVRDIKHVRGRIVPAVSAKALNQTARRYVEPKAVALMSDQSYVTSTGDPIVLSKSVIRWRYNASGTRTKKRRLVRRNASAKRDVMVVTWRWGKGSSEPGRIPIVSLPGRQQTKRGVRPGRKGAVIRGAFLQRNKHGAAGVYKRQGKKRYPIDFLRVDITRQADAAFAKFIDSSGTYHRREWNRLMRVELKKFSKAKLASAARQL